MSVLTITKDNFEAEVLKADVPVLVDFWAEWCGPCRMMSPIVEQLAVDMEGKAIIGKLNIDENDEVVSENRIRSIPTVLFFKGGEVVDRSVGLVKLEDLESKLTPLF